MLFFCYRQIFIRRPFRSGRVCAFFCDGLLVTRDNVLGFFGLKFPFFSCRTLPFSCLSSLSRDLRATVLSLSLTHYSKARFFFLGLRCFGSAQHDNVRGFVKRLLALSTD